MNRIAVRLRAIRQERGYKQNVGIAAGLSQSGLSKWENGGTPSAFDWLAYLAQRYGVSTDWLLGMTDDPVPAPSRDLPVFGAEVLALMREMPDVYAQQVRDHAQVVAQSYIDSTWLELVSVAVSVLGRDTVNEIAGRTRETLLAHGEEAAIHKWLELLAVLGGNLSNNYTKRQEHLAANYG